ncbi:phosphatidylglycerophosphatase GEP4 [Geosmithia morbida]|uniref:Phosphatidylglycerophosphatase GEP4 n=1 Tax=Geosmithia morbida TaxID=1094350 RepID=A0A9P4YR70_9HYPO|nr:phosphatidylglycerophosphatase GEP4 [Geosmithia morbida]KAF4120580.1 phosphatidylglycerophosphatase GEP4 [Geosmithia morbida]
MFNLNLSASLNVVRILFKPGLCLPHHTISNFADLPIPLDKALHSNGHGSAQVRAVVLDKDDCFAYPDTNEAEKLEAGTGLVVLPHSVKKPGCGDEIMDYFRKHPETGVTHPSQIAVVGDRLMTDMMLANMMGGWGFWVRDAVAPPEKKSVSV